MKTIKLSPQEFINFKKIANFWYDFCVNAGVIEVKADKSNLLKIGY